MTTPAINDQLALICGESGSGKSASLRNLRNQERVLYLNCEAGKRLPFRNKFHSVTITDPYRILDYFDQTMPGTDGHGMFDVIVIDTITFMMDMFESVYVVGSANTMKAWGDYAQFFKTLMQDRIARSDKAVLCLAHTRTDLDEKAMEMKTKVPVKGSLANNGLEAYFSTIVSTKKLPLKDLGNYDPDLLHIDPQEEVLGFKHVFQTRLTKQTTGERIRAPMGLFTPEQTWIDNDAQLLLDHLHQFYN